jgi:hypothetical protein
MPSRKLKGKEKKKRKKRIFKRKITKEAKKTLPLLAPRRD